MSDVLNGIDDCENILRETALIMLEVEERKENFGNKEAWEHNITYCVR